jgi:hypothetical protein
MMRSARQAATTWRMPRTVAHPRCGAHDEDQPSQALDAHDVAEMLRDVDEPAILVGLRAAGVARQREGETWIQLRHHPDGRARGDHPRRSHIPRQDAFGRREGFRVRGSSSSLIAMAITWDISASLLISPVLA